MSTIDSQKALEETFYAVSATASMNHMVNMINQLYLRSENSELKVRSYIIKIFNSKRSCFEPII